MNTIRIGALLTALAAAAMLAGCQNSASATQPAATQASDEITPMGDSLNGPIPYPHWPFNIEQGGGGGRR